MGIFYCIFLQNKKGAENIVELLLCVAIHALTFNALRFPVSPAASYTSDMADMSKVFHNHHSPSVFPDNLVYVFHQYKDFPTT